MPVAALGEMAGLPCLNGNTFAIATARDKQLCKLAAQRAELETSNWVAVQPAESLDKLEGLNDPRCIKWVTGGNCFDIAGDGMARSALSTVGQRDPPSAG